MSKILHIFNFEEKFSKPFFQFLQANDFELRQHQLFHYGKHNPDYQRFNIKFTFAHYYSGIKHLKLLKDMFKSDKIIVHSLASPWLLLYLYLLPQLRPKIYWVIWGKDLYFYKQLPKKMFHHKVYEFFRKKVFKHIKHVVTYVPGDAELAKQWYQVNAIYHECLMYPSNLFKDIKTSTNSHNGINILLGNSADPSNNHSELLEKLLSHKQQINQIYSPLSYGSSSHAIKTIKLGDKLFNEKFKPLTKFIPYEEYLNLINKIDIAIFGHNRQQGMGNIITLLGLGKKVYMKKNTTSFKMFKDLQIHIFDVDKINLIGLDLKSKTQNINIIKNSFSNQKLKYQLMKLLS